MNPTEIIRKKRNGNPLSSDEMKFMIDGYVRGAIPEYQVASLLMAIFFRGMNTEETAEFTRLMLHSGDVIDLSGIAGVKVDKHSTGGVGDKISIPLAPIVAACGVPVPMISGRGLGHTGGTLDKLESIPGFRTDLTVEEYKKVIGEIGLVMIGQTNEIAPADKKMYALRDVTATVECIPLIAGSIMSKKLAEGIDALVLDVKTGRGAFMQTYEQSVELAQALVGIGTSFGKETVGFITDMNEPLGYAVGNWNEVVESAECLRGKDIADIMTLTYTLGGVMVWLGKKAGSIEEGIAMCKKAVASGKAYDKFLELVQRQGGDISYIEHPEKYSQTKHSIDITARHSGFITSIDSLEVGFTGIMLGAGRMKVDDTIDPSAGIMFHRKTGDTVHAGDTIAVISTNKKEVLEASSRRLLDAIHIGDSTPAVRPLIVSIVDKTGVRDYGK
ncbi:MAG: thymidine phosphorylase [Bacteroidota bacterium]|jgi:pyrimidine-nucleoside phosphorylase